MTAASDDAKPGNAPSGAMHPLAFYSELAWIDGRPLLDTIEPYRAKILVDVLWTFGDDGAPVYSMALCGRAKKNWKTSDLALAALYRFLAWPSPAGNDAFLVANDEGQAADDLALVKKLFAANPTLGKRVNVLSKEIARKDGRGVLRILPSRDIAGAHGKTYLFVGYDEIHGLRSHDLFEALAPDPTRPDVLTWVTSYAGIRHAPGIPLYDFMQTGKRGDDPRMYFSWYGGDYSTDPALADATPEARANPSMESWGNNGYLDTQRRRLPSHKFRRLHLNLPGAPEGAAFDGDRVIDAIVTGRRRLPPQPTVRYFGFVDMSGGSSDDAVLAIAHLDGVRTVLDSLMSQTGQAPFNPRHAVTKFCAELREYRLREVTADAYAGNTFRSDFEEHGISYEASELTASELFEELEPKLNAGEVELLDDGKLQEQLLTLVWRGTKIDHLPGDHNDFANAAAGAIWLASGRKDSSVAEWRMANFSALGAALGYGGIIAPSPAPAAAAADKSPGGDQAVDGIARSADPPYHPLQGRVPDWAGIAMLGAPTQDAAAIAPTTATSRPAPPPVNDPGDVVRAKFDFALGREARFNFTKKRWVHDLEAGQEDELARLRDLENIN